MPEISRRRPGKAVAAPPRPKKPTTGVIPDRYQAFVDGRLSVADLDDEEVFRGQLKDKNGTFRGKPPRYVPREFAAAVAKEAQKRFQAEMAGKIPEAMDAITRMLKKGSAQPGDGAIVNAAFKTIERYAGRVPENINMNVAPSTWDRAVEAVTVEEKIIDAEIVE